MCFSATASFATSAGLFVIGAITVTQAKTTPQRVFATIPLMFAVQQLAEGMLWLALSNPAYAQWEGVSKYAFLAFAHAVWPAFVPFTILLFEADRGRRQLLKGLFGVGLLTALYFVYCLLAYPVGTTMEGYHIRYDPVFPQAGRWISGAAYILASVASPLVSSSRKLRLFGFAILSAYLVTRIMYQDYFISVWCYFAAVLSAMVLLIIRQMVREPKTPGEAREVAV